MSTLKVNAVQVGQSPTATNNFTLESGDGKLKIGVGNQGDTQQVMAVYGDGSVKHGYIDAINAVYDSKLKSITAEDTLPNGLTFRPDGKKMYIIGAGQDRLREYNLTTAWDVSTASYFATSGSMSSQNSAPQDFFFKPDGTKGWMVGTASPGTVFEYTFSTPWDATTATYASISLNVSATDSDPDSIWFKPDGTRIFITGNTNDIIMVYDLPTPWTLTGASYVTSVSISAYETGSGGIAFSGDGTQMFLIGSNGDSIDQFSLTTPWDVTTLVHEGLQVFTSYDGTLTAFYIKPDGSKLYILGQDNDTVYQFSLPVQTVDWTGETNINGTVSVYQDFNVHGAFNVTGSLNVVDGTNFRNSIGAAADISTQTIFVPAQAFYARDTNGASQASSESTTHKVMTKGFDFDAATAQYIQTTFTMPKGWNGGTITAIIMWSNLTNTTGSVVWGIQGQNRGDIVALDQAFGTAVTVTDACDATQNYSQISAETSAITFSGLTTGQKIVKLQVYRDAANGSDTATANARLLGVIIKYGTTSLNDA